MTSVLRQRIWWGLGILGFVAILILAREPVIALIPQREHVRDWVQSFGVLAPVAYIALYVLQILAAPIPGNVISVMGGYLFGSAAGVIYSLLGLGLGAGLAAALARRLGRPLIERFAGEQGLQKWERRLRIRSPIIWGLIFLLPTPDAVYYLAGLSGMPLRAIILVAMIGRAPSLIVSNWLGALTATLSPMLLATLVALVGAVGFVAYRHERRLRLIGLLALRFSRRLNGGT
jgi:uncharacterized membrane protein YdjX (TVP38/TMEM64 family)